MFYLTIEQRTLNPQVEGSSPSRVICLFRGSKTLWRGLRGLKLIGADVVEVAPPFDPSGNTALVAATMMFEILSLLAESVALHERK